MKFLNRKFSRGFSFLTREAAGALLRGAPVGTAQSRLPQRMGAPRFGCPTFATPLFHVAKLGDHYAHLLSGLDQLIQFRHHLECIGNVDHVSFAARPSAVGVERDGAPLPNEPPPDNVRLFAMTAGREASRVTRCSPGLADLVHVGEERKNGLPVSALIDERLAAAQRSTRCAQEI